MDYVYIHRCIIGMFRAAETLPAKDRYLVFTKDGVNLQDFHPGKSNLFSVHKVPANVFRVGLSGAGWDKLTNIIIYYINMRCKLERPIFTAPDKWTSQIHTPSNSESEAVNDPATTDQP